MRWSACISALSLVLLGAPAALAEGGGDGGSPAINTGPVGGVGRNVGQRATDASRNAVGVVNSRQLQRQREQTERGAEAIERANRTREAQRVARARAQREAAERRVAEAQRRAERGWRRAQRQQWQRELDAFERQYGIGPRTERQGQAMRGELRANPEVFPRDPPRRDDQVR